MDFPKLLIITDRARMKPSWELALLAACQGGARWFCLREKDAPPREQLDLYRRAARRTEAFRARLFLTGRADLTRASHAEGLHLPEDEISVADARLSLGFHTPMGRSVHDLEGAQRAAAEGADYLLFGAVWKTFSHPGQSGAGLDALATICQSVSVPIFAVGGVTADNAPQCLAAGAAGVALISGVWDAPDVTARVRELRAALGERDEPLHGHSHGAPAGETDGAPKSSIKSPFSDIITRNRENS